MNFNTYVIAKIFQKKLLFAFNNLRAVFQFGLEK